MPSPIDQRLSDKITLMSLYCAVLVTFNHAYTIDTSYAEVAHQSGALFNCTVQDFIKFGLARVSTPFFFMFSAWILFTRAPGLSNWWPDLRKRLRTVGVPLLIWSLSSFALVAGLQAAPPLQGYFSEPLLALRGWELVDRLLWNPVAHQLWFLRDLLLLVAAAPLVHLALRNRWVGAGILAVIACCWYQQAWFEVRDIRGVLFFGIGAWIAIHKPTLTASRTQVIVAVATWLALISANTWWVLTRAELQPGLYNTAILIGLLALWTLYDQVAPRIWASRAAPALRFLGGYTFLIYVAHVPADTLVLKALVAVLGDGQYALLTAFFATAVIVLVGCVGGAVLAQRFVPGAYALVTGGRGRSARVGKGAAQPIAPALGGSNFARTATST